MQTKEEGNQNGNENNMNSNTVKQTPEGSYSMLLNSRIETKKEDSKHSILNRHKNNDLQPHFQNQNLSQKKGLERGQSESSYIEESLVGTIQGISQVPILNLEQGSIDVIQDQSLVFGNQGLHGSIGNSSRQSGMIPRFVESRNQIGRLVGDDSIISRSPLSKDNNSRPMLFSSHFQKTSIVDEEQRNLERMQGYEFRSQFLGKSTYIPVQHRDPKLIWKKGFFQIIRYVNKFLFTLKKTMIFRRPHLLEEHQINAIDDKSAKQFSEGFGQKSKKLARVVRSNIRFLRKIRIMSLLLKKSLKFVINPYTKFKNKCLTFFDQISKKIPVIMPYSKISNFTDFLHGLLILFFLVTIPFELAFQYKTVDIIEYQTYDIMRLFLFAQIVINFYTAFYDKGCIVVQKRRIFKRYAFKFFIFDFLALLCLYETLYVFSSFQKLFFFVKIKSLKEIVSKFREQFHMHEKSQVFIQVIILFFQTFLLCHFFACTFYYIARWEKEHGYENWIQHYSAQEGNVLQNGMFSKYIVSLYFSVILIGTIGFGDYCPQTEIEMFYILILGLLASGFFGYVLSQISEIIREIAKKEGKFKGRLKELNRYLNFMEVSPDLQIQARKYLEYINKEGNIYSNQHQSLNQLSKYLREGIFKEVYVKSLMQIPYLKQNFSTPFIQKLALSMKEMSFGPDELIMKRGILEEQFLFFVASGEVEIFMDVSQDINKLTHNCIKPFKKLKRGDHFGSVEFFTNKKCVQYNVRSLGVSRIQCLSLHEFMQTIEEFPQDREVYCFLRDNFIYNSNHYMLNQKCLSCGSSTHLVQNCQLIFYTPHQLRVIRIYNKNNEAIRANFKRSLKRTRYKTLTNMAQMEKDIEKFMVDNNGYFDASTYFDESDCTDMDEDYEGFENDESNNSLQEQLEKQNELLNQKIEGIPNQNKNLNTKSPPQQKLSAFNQRIHDMILSNVSENINEEENDEQENTNNSASGQIQYKLNVQTNNESGQTEQVKPRSVSFAQYQTNYNQEQHSMENKKTQNSFKDISINNLSYNKHQWHFCEEELLSSAPSNQQLNPQIFSTLNDLDFVKRNINDIQQNSDQYFSSNQLKMPNNSNSKNNTQSSFPLSQKQSGGQQTASINAISSPSKQFSNPSTSAFKWPPDPNSIVNMQEKLQSPKTELDLNQIAKIQKKMLLRKNKTDQQRSKEERLKKARDSNTNSIQAFVQTLMQKQQIQKEITQSPDQKAPDLMKNNKQLQDQKKANNSIQMLNQFIRRASQVVPQYQGHNMNNNSISNSLINFDLPPSSTNLKIASQVNLKNIEDQDLTKMKKLLELLGVNEQDQQNVNDNYLDATRFFDKYPFDVMKSFKIYFPNYNFKNAVLQANRITKNQDHYKFKKKRTIAADRKKTFMEHKKTIITDRNKGKKKTFVTKKNNSDTNSITDWGQ